MDWMSAKSLRQGIALPALLLLLAAIIASGAEPGQHRGGLVLQFDDGWTEWATVLAPELAKVGGVATVFVNNKYLASGRITRDDLRALQGTYGWEIGTHTVNHHDAPRFVRQNGLDLWLDQELDASIRELRDAGLTVRSLVFPFNSFTPEIAQAARARVDTFRRADRLAIASGVREDGSLPATSIDSTRYTPLPMLRQWVDMAHRRGELLLLYGHRVLPDSAFVTGLVVEVSARELKVDVPVELQIGEEYALVPNTDRRVASSDPFRVVRAEGGTIVVESGDLTKVTSPGAGFLMGPSYGTRMSDFRALIEYAAPRLRFYTVSDIADGKHRE